MDGSDGLDALLAASHEAIEAFTRGDAEPLKALYAHADYVTIANPFGPPARGWADAAATMDRAATYYRDGRVLGFDRVSEGRTSEMAYTLEIERLEAKMGGADVLSPVALRTTCVYQIVDGAWRIVHRHADPITAERDADSVIQPTRPL